MDGCLGFGLSHVGGEARVGPLSEGNIGLRIVPFKIELTRAEYEEVRSASTHFAVVPNHENPESEQVVSEGSRFAVIDKIEGWSLRIARETDARSSSNGRSGRPS